jgi:hypothetical protein
MNLLAEEMEIWRGTPSICEPLSHDGASSWLHLSEDGRFTFPHWRARYLRPQLTSRLLAGWLNVYARVAQAKIITLHISMAASGLRCCWWRTCTGQVGSLLFQRSQTFAPAARAARRRRRKRHAQESKQDLKGLHAAASGRTRRPQQPRTRLGRIRGWIWTACIGFAYNESKELGFVFETMICFFENPLYHFLSTAESLSMYQFLN